MDNWQVYLVSAAFAMHGLGMLGAALTLPIALRSGKAQGFGHSWLLQRFGTDTEALLGTIIWGLAGLGFLVAAVGFLISAPWWVFGVYLGAPLTVVAIALWFGSVPAGAYAGGVFAALALGVAIFAG